jgi:hypothetical protein
MAKRRGLDKHSRKHTGEASHKAVGDLPMAAQRRSTPTLVRCLSPLQREATFGRVVRAALVGQELSHSQAPRSGCSRSSSLERGWGCISSGSSSRTLNRPPN